MIEPEILHTEYSAPITRKTPSLFVFLLDRSASMNEETVVDGQKGRKSAMLVRIINIALEEILLRCKYADGFRNYFDLCVIGYNDNSCTNLLDYACEGKEICTVGMLASASVKRVVYERRFQRPDGERHFSSIRVGNYIQPHASGNTPMQAGLQKAYTIVKKWCKAHEKDRCFPPMIFNITDGEASGTTEEKLLKIADKIKKLSTADGHVLFFNMHLNKNPECPGTLFPASEEELEKEDRYAKLLYRMSSTLPRSFYPDINNIRPIRLTDSTCLKAMGYNSKIMDILKIINIGSLSVTKIG